MTKGELILLLINDKLSPNCLHAMQVYIARFSSSLHALQANDI